jgi:hypothetical protein
MVNTQPGGAGPYGGRNQDNNDAHGGGGISAPDQAKIQAP